MPSAPDARLPRPVSKRNHPFLYHIFVKRTARRMVGCPFLHVTIQGNFALRRDLLLSTGTKVGKNTGRNLRFLHFRARYNVYKIVSVCRTITGDCLFRFVKGSSLHQRRCR